MPSNNKRDRSDGQTKQNPAGQGISADKPQHERVTAPPVAVHNRFEATTNRFIGPVLNAIALGCAFWGWKRPSPQFWSAAVILALAAGYCWARWPLREECHSASEAPDGKGAPTDLKPLDSWAAQSLPVLDRADAAASIKEPRPVQEDASRTLEEYRKVAKELKAVCDRLNDQDASLGKAIDGFRRQVGDESSKLSKQYCQLIERHSGELQTVEEMLSTEADRLHSETDRLHSEMDLLRSESDRLLGGWERLPVGRERYRVASDQLLRRLQGGSPEEQQVCRPLNRTTDDLMKFAGEMVELDFGETENVRRAINTVFSSPSIPFAALLLNSESLKSAQSFLREIALYQCHLKDELRKTYQVDAIVPVSEIDRFDSEIHRACANPILVGDIEKVGKIQRVVAVGVRVRSTVKEQASVVCYAHVD